MMAVTQQSNYTHQQHHQQQQQQQQIITNSTGITGTTTTTTAAAATGTYAALMNSSGVFVHSNPPRPLLSSSSSVASNQNTTIRNWIRSGDIDKLENVVLEGQGARLLGLMDSTSDVKVKTFLRGIPGYMAKVDLIHDAVIRGSVRELQTLLDKKKLSLARDAVGRGLAHKAVLHSQKNVLEWLGKKYPDSVLIRDNESRTCLHYSGISKNPTDMYNFLINIGCSPEVIDIHGRKASYYLTNPQELYIEGVSGSIGGGGGTGGSGGATGGGGFLRKNRNGGGAGANKLNRRRISPISPKSSPSPPVTTSMNPSTLLPQNLSAGAKSSSPAGSWSPVTGGLGSVSSVSPAITRAQIRIWIHEKDISKLEQIVWSGNGDKLLLETTNNPKVRRFLDNVPQLLHHIKLIHTAAIHNDVEGLKEMRSRIEQSGAGGHGIGNGGAPPPHPGSSISPELFTARDSYGLSAMHKATGLNNRAASEYLLYEFPSSLNLQDNAGRTPLHYAAARVSSDASNNVPESIYKFLQRAGADHTLVDYKHQDAGYYVGHPGECDSFKFLRNIPDAPRVISSPDKGLVGWDRSGVARLANQQVNRGNASKRKISSPGEFGGSVTGAAATPGVVEVNDEKLDQVGATDDADERDGSGGKVAKRNNDQEDDIGVPGYAASGGGNRIREQDDDFLDEEDDDDVMIEDVGDGYVADSDEGKYDLTHDDVVIDGGDVGEEEEQEDDPAPASLSPARSPQRSHPATPGVPVSPGPPEIMDVEEDRDEEKKSEDSNDRKQSFALPSAPQQEQEDEEEQFNHPPPDYEEALTSSPAARSPDPPHTTTPYPIVAPSPEKSVPRSSVSSSQVNDDPSTIPPSSAPPPPPRSPSPTVEDYIAASDMESLVNLVLRGRGDELVDKRSHNPEIQEFLNNVPAYMAKISSIHNAAHTGNMRDLQSLLDRKRLAEAQDSRGRGPLHHAVVGNHPQVVRYLVNGYPQCIDLVDLHGRTGLHYAATLPDSGTMYKVLIQAGADPNIKDQSGNTPGIYLRRKDLLKLEDLIQTGSADGVRKVQKRGSENVPVAVAAGAVAGAGVLVAAAQQEGDTGVDSWERPATPFPKSAARDVSIVTIHQTRTPPDVSAPLRSRGEQQQQDDDDDDDDDDQQLELPVQNLTLLNSFYLEVLSRDSDSIWSRTWKKLTTGNSTDIAHKYVKRYLTPKVFHKIKMRSTPRYNSTLLDCIKFYPQFFIVAPDPHAYSSFAEAFIPAICDCNGVDEIPVVHPEMVLQGSMGLLPSYPIVDLPSKFIHQVRVRVSRNLRPFPFIPIMKREDLTEIQRTVRRLFASDHYEWFEMEALEKDEREELVEERGVWFPEATKISRFWPKGRGFLCTESGSTQIWVNAEDHVDVVVTSQYGKLHPVMETVVEVMDKFKDACEFHFNSQCGFLTVDPFRCGTGVRITFRLRLPQMMQNRAYLTNKCDDLKLSLKWKQKYRIFGSSSPEINPDDWVEVENVRTCGVDENQIVLGMIRSVSELIKDEEEQGRAFDRAITKKKDHDEPGPAGPTTNESTTGVASRGSKETRGLQLEPQPTHDTDDPPSQQQDPNHEQEEQLHTQEPTEQEQDNQPPVRASPMRVSSPGNQQHPDDQEPNGSDDRRLETVEMMENSNNNFPAIWSEEGKYLANVLGDALVKGLSLVSQQRPNDPVEYLANFLRKYKDGEEQEQEEEQQLDVAGLAAAATAVVGGAGVVAAAAAATANPSETEPEGSEEPVRERTDEEEKVAEAGTEAQEPEPGPPEDTDPPPTAPQPPPSESNLNSDLTAGYDALEDALLEEEEGSRASPFDPEKDEQAERALLESSSNTGDPNSEEGETSPVQTMHNSTRDESGQSVLHFACTRPGGGSTILAFLQNPSVNLGWRDVNMRTARDIATNLNRMENARVIDSWVLALAQRNDIETLETLLLDGYDHIADVEDAASGNHIVEVAEEAGNRDCALLLRGVPEFRERVDRVHRCVRSGDIDGVKSLVGQDRRVGFALSPKTGRNAMHVAVLCEEISILKWLADTVPECVKRGDNLERTCLHYAMGVDKVEKIVRILVRAGAKRVVKDLRDRQPSWYFMHKDEIGQLQAEERAIVN